LNYLLDTNILSELRKGPQCDPGVNQWLAGCEDEQLFTSVLCLGEIRMGIDAVRPRDRRFAARLQLWLDYIIDSFEGRILPVCQAIALEWGRLAAPSSRAPVDELLAATALTHRMTLVTRNVRDVERTGVEYVNPFQRIH
jgi:toxin FitB